MNTKLPPMQHVTPGFWAALTAVRAKRMQQAIPDPLKEIREVADSLVRTGQISVEAKRALDYAVEIDVVLETVHMLMDEMERRLQHMTQLAVDVANFNISAPVYIPFDPQEQRA